MSEGMTIPEYDVMVFKGQQEDKIRAHQRALARWKAVGEVGIALVVCLGFLGFVYLMWQANKGPSATDELGREIRLACIDNGGSWITSARETFGGACLMGQLVEDPRS